MKMEELKCDLNKICGIIKGVTRTLNNEIEPGPENLRALGLRELAKQSESAFGIAHTLLQGLVRGEKIEDPAASEDNRQS